MSTRVSDTVVLVARLGPQSLGTICRYLIEGRVHVHYLDATPWGERWARRLLAFRGSVLGRFAPDLTRVLEGATPLREAVHEKVVATSGRIADRFMADASLTDFLPKGVERSRRRAFLERELCLALYHPILLALAADHASEQAGRGRVVVVTDIGSLARVLEEEIQGPLSARFVGYTPWRKGIFVRGTVFLLEQLRGLALSPFRRRAVPAAAPTVAVQASQGFEGNHFGTNDLWWWESSEIPGEQTLVFFFGTKKAATDEVIRSLRELGVRCRILERRANRTSSEMTSPYPPKSIDAVVRDQARAFAVTRRVLFTRGGTWQVSLWLRAIVGMRRWEAFFREENIRAVFSTVMSTSDMLSPAADLSDAATLMYHWWVAEYPKNARSVLVPHVFFAWGKFMLPTVTSERWDCPEVVVASGSIFDHLIGDLEVRSRAAVVRQTLGGECGRKVITMLDRSMGIGSYYPPERHVEFYDKLLEMVEQSDALALVIKPKRTGPSGPAAFDVEPALGARARRLASQGKCMILEGSTSVVEAALAGDVVVSLGYNSGGMVAALAGARSVFWDPAQLGKSPRGDWFAAVGWSNPDVVFVELSRLVSALEGLLLRSGLPPEDSSLGRLGRALDGLDLFRDGMAGSRILFFVRAYLEELEGGGGSRRALAKAVDRYSGLWGPEAVLRSFSEEGRPVPRKTSAGSSSRASSRTR